MALRRIGDFDLARRIGTIIYQLRDVVATARRPFMMSHEFPDGYNPDDKSTRGNAYAHLFNQRFQPVRDCAVAIQSLSNEAEALWGADLVTTLNDLLKIARRLQTAMEAYVEDQEAGGSHFSRVPAFGISTRVVVFDSGVGTGSAGRKGVPNSFSAEINPLVEKAAAYLRSKLPRPQLAK